MIPRETWSSNAVCILRYMNLLAQRLCLRLWTLASFHLDMWICLEGACSQLQEAGSKVDDAQIL
jgi:hypothetical protein